MHKVRILSSAIIFRGIRSRHLISNFWYVIHQQWSVCLSDGQKIHVRLVLVVLPMQFLLMGGLQFLCYQQEYGAAISTTQ